MGPVRRDLDASDLADDKIALLQGLPPRLRVSPADVPTVPRGDAAPFARQSLPHPYQRSPGEATKNPLCRAFSMGGTGLEPVTPSLSIRGSVRVSSLVFAQTAWLSGIDSASERLSEPERTVILAILATVHQPCWLVLASPGDIPVRDLRPLTQPVAVAFTTTKPTLAPTQAQPRRRAPPDGARGGSDPGQSCEQQVITWAYCRGPSGGAPRAGSLR
jgi:hypothetical protein